MAHPRAALRQHIAKLAEIPRLLSPSVLPPRWDGDAPEIRNARGQIALQDFFYKTLPSFGLPSWLLDEGGAILLDNGETRSSPGKFSLPESSEGGFAFSEHDGNLIALLAIRLYWPQAPEGACWLALEINRAFFEKTAPLDGANLTNGEYQLIAHLLAGRDLKEAAERLNASYDTKRKQLQVVFQKFGVANQTALTRAVSTQLLSHFIAAFSNSRNESPERQLLNRFYGGKVLVHSVALEGGDALPIWEFGDRRGRPCLFFHGLVSPMPFCTDTVEILRRNRLRWLVTPRFLASDPDQSDPSRFLEKHTQSVAETIRHLIGEPVVCVAVNSGVAWATHFAAQHPDLVDSLVIAGAPFPPSQATPGSERSMQVALTSAVRQRPIIISALVKAYAALARSPALAARAYLHAYRESPADLAIIGQSIDAGWALSWLRLIGERATASVVADLAVNQRSWDSEIAGLDMTLTFLQGAEDTMCPPPAIAALARTNPQARFESVAKAGHHVASSHFARLCATLAADDASAESMAASQIGELSDTINLMARPD